MEHFPSNDICDRTKLSEACQAEFELNEYLCDQIWRLPLDRVRIHQSIALAHSGGKLVCVTRCCSHPRFVSCNHPWGYGASLVFTSDHLKDCQGKGQKEDIHAVVPSQWGPSVGFKQRVRTWHGPEGEINGIRKSYFMACWEVIVSSARSTSSLCTFPARLAFLLTRCYFLSLCKVSQF